MASAAPLARSDDRVSSFDPLDRDAIGFDAWLLPPVVPHGAERAMRFASRLAGPVALAAALAATLHWLV